MFESDLCRARVAFTLTTTSPLLIGGTPALRRHPGNPVKARGAADLAPEAGWVQPGEDRAVAVSFHDIAADGKPVYRIPGASLRGVLRHHLTDVLTAVLQEENRRDDAAFRVDAEEPPAEEASLDDWESVFGPSLVRQLFGSTARKGLLRVEGGSAIPRPSRGTYSGQSVPLGGRELGGVLRFVTQNQLDRFSQATTHGLRNIAPLEVGTRFKLAIEVRNFAWWTLGALFLALDGFTTCAVRLGAKGSIGFGKMSVAIDDVRLRYHAAIAPHLARNTGTLPGIGAAAGDLDNGALFGTSNGPNLWWCDGADHVDRGLFSGADGIDDPFVAAEFIARPDRMPDLARAAKQRLVAAARAVTATA